MKIKIGCKITSKSMTVKITEEIAEAYRGRIIHNGRDCGAAEILKSTLNNPHYTKNLEITYPTCNLPVGDECPVRMPCSECGLNY